MHMFPSQCERKYESRRKQYKSFKFTNNLVENLFSIVWRQVPHLWYLSIVYSLRKYEILESPVRISVQALFIIEDKFRIVIVITRCILWWSWSSFPVLWPPHCIWARCNRSSVSCRFWYHSPCRLCSCKRIFYLRILYTRSNTHRHYYYIGNRHSFAFSTDEHFYWISKCFEAFELILFIVSWNYQIRFIRYVNKF
jgi:hypothetical protein